MTETWCYVASSGGRPGYSACCVDDPKYFKDTNESIAEWIRDGRIVTRVTMEEARKGMAVYIAGKKKSKISRKKS